MGVRRWTREFSAAVRHRGPSPGPCPHPKTRFPALFSRADIYRVTVAKSTMLKDDSSVLSRGCGSVKVAIRLLWRVKEKEERTSAIWSYGSYAVSFPWGRGQSTNCSTMLQAAAGRGAGSYCTLSGIAYVLDVYYTHPLFVSFSLTLPTCLFVV